jgi:hypothetical protein
MEAMLENLNGTMTASLTGTVAETIGMTVIFRRRLGRSFVSSATVARFAKAKSSAFATGIRLSIS